MHDQVLVRVLDRRQHLQEQPQARRDIQPVRARNTSSSGTPSTCSSTMKGWPDGRTPASYSRATLA